MEKENGYVSEVKRAKLLMDGQTSGQTSDGWELFKYLVSS